MSSNKQLSKLTKKQLLAHIDKLDKPHKGRPVKYRFPSDIKEKGEEYFTKCTSEGLHINITGLCLYLDLTREGLREYGNKEEFSDTVKKLKLRVENAYENRLNDRGGSGDIFGLKQFGWKDKQEIDHTTGGDKIKETVIILPSNGRD